MSVLRLSRRTLIASALAAPFVTRLRAFAAEPKALVLPKLDEGRLVDGVREFDLTVALGKTEFLPGLLTDTVGINAPFLGPLVKLRAGEAVRLNVTSTLGQKIALHWHGLALPPAMDGGPHQAIGQNETWSPEFTVANRAGTYWFHAHAHGKTGLHVWGGMAGAIRVEDEEEAALPLPRTYGEDDFLLILQDRTFDDKGQMPYNLTVHDKMAGLQGDTMLVNGQIAPELRVTVPRIRLRILNGANGSIYRLHFADGRSFAQIASDGGLLAAPVQMTESWLAPGERGEYILDLSDGEATLLRAELFGAEAAVMGPVGIKDVLPIVPSGGQAPAPALPAILSNIAAPVETSADRPMVLSMSGEGMMGDLLINGAQYDHERIDFLAPAGATERWIFDNKTPMLHPMHIHGGQFRILTRNGAPPAPAEAGLKDVVLVHPDEKVEVAMTYPAQGDLSAPLMYHCHILEHEDAGMMGQFVVM